LAYIYVLYLVVQIYKENPTYIAASGIIRGLE
jgi:hypothetical protein